MHEGLYAGLFGLTERVLQGMQGSAIKNDIKNQKKKKRYYATLHSSIHLNDSEPLLKDSWIDDWLNHYTSEWFEWLLQKKVYSEQRIKKGLMQNHSDPSAILTHIKTLQHEKHVKPFRDSTPSPEALEIIKIPRRRNLF